MATDKERIDWLEEQAMNGACPGLVNDDNGHWAVSCSGFQNAVCGEETQDVETTFFVEAKEWKGSVRDAIDSAMNREVR